MKISAWTVPDLLELSGGYWAACTLHAGVRLDIFSHLEGVTLSAGELASLCGCEPRATGMLLDALSSIGLIEKNTSGYTNCSFSSQFLVKSAPGYMGHIIKHHHHLMANWSILHESIMSGEPVREKLSHGDDESERESFLMGMYNLASLLAPSIASAIDLSKAARLLDLGGGPGTYAIHFCQHNPSLTAVVYDLPNTRPFAELMITRNNLADRISFMEGDFNFNSVPIGFDVVWISHVLHSEGVEGCRMILEKGVNALNSGGMLMIQEFILNEAKDGPPFPALFSLNMLLGTPSGRSYSESEIRELMVEAGLGNVRRLPITLPNGAGIMAGIAV